MRLLRLLPLLVVALCAGVARAETPPCVVDVEQVLLHSRAGRLGREHIKAVRARLEEGYARFANEVAKLPEEARQQELREAARLLTQRLETEKTAAHEVVNTLMLEEIRRFREENAVPMILPKHLVFVADSKYDITEKIIAAMDKRTPEFGKLPEIHLQKPPEQP